MTSTFSKTCGSVADEASAIGSKRRTSEKYGELELARRAACELQIGAEAPVAGSLYRVKLENQNKHTSIFITTNKQLPANSSDDLLNAQLLLRDMDQGKDVCKCIPLANGRVLTVWNTPPRKEHSGNTVVELSNKAARECKSRGAHFLEIVEARAGEEVAVWFWWPLSGGETPLKSFKPRALIESVNAEELQVLLDGIPESVRDKWGERGHLLLLQLYGGASAILINKRGEALAMDTIMKVDLSAEVDKNFAVSQGIDTNKHTYPFKAKVVPLSLLLNRNCEQQLVDAAPLKLPKEPKEISEQEFECAVCKYTAEKAVHCVKCQNIVCESHLPKLEKCPYCNLEPFETQSNKFVRRLICKLDMPCPMCGAPIPRGDMSTHITKFCPKREGAELKGTQHSQKIVSFVSTASGSAATTAQMVENAVAATGGEMCTQLEGISKPKPADRRCQLDKFCELISQLKLAYANKFNFLIELLNKNRAYFQQTYNESDQQVTPLELIEYLIVILRALKHAFAHLQSSQDSEHASKVVSSDAAAFNLSVDTLKAQCQRAVEMISSFQCLLRRLLMNGEEVSDEDNGSNESQLSSEIMQITRSLFSDLAELSNEGKTECDRAIVISEMTDKLEKFFQQFTLVMVPQTREFKSVLAALESKRSSSSNNAVATPTKELIRQELEMLKELQRALTSLDVLLTNSSSKDFSPLTISHTSPTGFELATGIYGECHRAIITITSLISLLNSTVCQKLPQLRSGLGETKAEDLEHSVLQIILELRGKLGKFVHQENKHFTVTHILKEIANAIFDCYNFIPDTIFKYLSLLMVERENQKYEDNRRLLNAQMEISCQQNLIKERDTKFAKIQQQINMVQSQLEEFQKQKTDLENLALERDTTIANIQPQVNGVRNQLEDFQKQKTDLENLVRERDTTIANIQQQLNGVRSQLEDFHKQKTDLEKLVLERGTEISNL